MPRLNPFDMMRKISNTPGQTQQPTNIQTPLKQYDFLAELAKEGQTQPTLANLVRTA
jgi:hypothetical protein